MNCSGAWEEYLHLPAAGLVTWAKNRVQLESAEKCACVIWGWEPGIQGFSLTSVTSNQLLTQFNKFLIPFSR